MDDYISREKALQFRLSVNASREASRVTVACGVADAIAEYIKAIPAANVRPVVYCRECIYNDKCFSQSIFKEVSRIPFDKNSFFCADGKRRGTNMKEEKQ